MAGRVISKQVRYNWTVDEGEQTRQRYRWVFLVINEPDKIREIKDRIYEQMALIVDQRKIDSGIVQNSGNLHYELFSFSTDCGRIENPHKICDIKAIPFMKDTNLADEKSDGLSLLING